MRDISRMLFYAPTLDQKDESEIHGTEEGIALYKIQILALEELAAAMRQARVLPDLAEAIDA